MPNVAWSAATTRSHESMISQPPASAAPLTAAMMGLGNSRWVMPAKPPEPPMMEPPSPAAKALRSIPAEKALSPAPVRTTTAHRSSVSSSSSAAAMATLTSPLMALRASGRLMVRISTCPRRSRSTAGIGCSLLLLSWPLFLLALVLWALSESDRTGSASPPGAAGAMWDRRPSAAQAWFSRAPDSAAARPTPRSGRRRDCARPGR